MILFSIKVSSQTLFANVKGDLKACKIRVIVLHRCDTDAWSFQFWWCLLKADLHIALGCATKTMKITFQLVHEKFQLASDQEQGFRKDVLTKYERNQNSEYSLKSGTP